MTTILQSIATYLMLGIVLGIGVTVATKTINCLWPDPPQPPISVVHTYEHDPVYINHQEPSHDDE